METDKRGALSCAPFPVRMLMNHKAWTATCTGFSTLLSTRRIRSATVVETALDVP